MSLLKNVVILIILLEALIFPISASGDMSGSVPTSSVPGSGGCYTDPFTGEITCVDSSGSPSGSTSSETGGTIIVTTSGGYSGGYPGQGSLYPGQPGSFTSGYQSPTSGGVTLGYTSPGDPDPALQRFTEKTPVLGNPVPYDPNTDAVMQKLIGQYGTLKEMGKELGELAGQEADPNKRITLQGLQQKTIDMQKQMLGNMVDLESIRLNQIDSHNN